MLEKCYKPIIGLQRSKNEIKCCCQVSTSSDEHAQQQGFLIYCIGKIFNHLQEHESSQNKLQYYFRLRLSKCKSAEVPGFPRQHLFRQSTFFCQGNCEVACQCSVKEKFGRVPSLFDHLLFFLQEECSHITNRKKLNFKRKMK